LPGGATPAPEVRVEIVNAPWASDETDGSGAYSFLAPVGTHTVALTAKDGSLEHIALEPLTGVMVALPGPMTLDITLAQATSGRTVVIGTAFQPDGISTVAGAEVTARNQSGAILGRAFSDAAGNYALVIP
jgi:hypothetical protein